MKTKYLFLFAICCMLFANLNHSFAQCLPMIKIDGNDIIADDNNTAGIKLPTWLKAGQTLAKGQYVFSLAVIEFTVNGAALDYSQNLSVTTIQTVPSGKVWKVESVHKDATIAIPPSTTTFSTPATYTYSPTCNGTYRLQVWGGGGGGDGGDGGSCGSIGGGGGGGGGYSEGNFYLLSATTYSVIVGIGGTAGTYATSAPGGTGGTSSVSVISLSATGGIGGDGWCTGFGGAGGAGSGGSLNSVGQTGTNGVGSSSGGRGGDGANGGAGGAGVNSGSAGIGSIPGGGGGGHGYGTGISGGAGGAGKVVISMSSGSSSSSASRESLKAVNVVNASVTSACGYTVPFGYVFRLDGAIAGAGTSGFLSLGSSCNAQDRGAIYLNYPLESGPYGAAVAWPYPQWFVGGTYFYFAAGTAYIHGMEYSIQQ